MMTSMVKVDWENSRNHLGRDCGAPKGGVHVNGMTYQVCDFETRFGLAIDSPAAQIRYTKFYLNNASSQKGEKGSLVIAPGRAESSLKYIEVAYDFLKRGYSPVYAIDHRSQGFSSRSLENQNIVHVADFNNYTEDFKDFVNKVVLTDPSINKEKLFLISNSMGGAITAMYLEQNETHPFKATAMFGAMFKIEYPKPYSEFLAKLISNVVCNIDIPSFDCDGYAPGRGGDFDEAQRIFLANPLTHSRNRYEMRNEIWRKRPWMVSGGISYKWIQSSTNVASVIRRDALKISIPMMLVTAGEDSIVDPVGQSEVCLNAPKCVRYLSPGARHEVLMEKDSIRGHWLGYYLTAGRPSAGGLLFDFLENPQNHIK